MSSRVQYAIAFVMILAASFSRLIPHPANVAPIAAIALFGGVYFDKKFALIVPLAALLISDFFIGFYGEIVFVYAGFILAGLVGVWLKNHKSVGMIAGATMASSLIFFVITNYGSWISMPSVYERSVAGLIACYIAAIPFFRNSLAGDLVYVALLFGSYELVLRYAVKRTAVQA
ncbi:MAG: DUF6580 family putative transport protein [Bacteroidota bacterium]|jgi:hypothetical protein